MRQLPGVAVCWSALDWLQGQQQRAAAAAAAAAYKNSCSDTAAAQHISDTVVLQVGKTTMAMHVLLALPSILDGPTILQTVIQAKCPTLVL
jgi:hypothetical protein